MFIFTIKRRLSPFIRTKALLARWSPVEKAANNTPVLGIVTVSRYYYCFLLMWAVKDGNPPVWIKGYAVIGMTESIILHWPVKHVPSSLDLPVLTLLDEGRDRMTGHG